MCACVTWRADSCGFESHPRQPIFLWKMTVLGELCCVALPFCCLLLLLPCLSQHLFDWLFMHACLHVIISLLTLHRTPVANLKRRPFSTWKETQSVLIVDNPVSANRWSCSTYHPSCYQDIWTACLDPILPFQIRNGRLSIMVVFSALSVRVFIGRWGLMCLGYDHLHWMNGGVLQQPLPQPHPLIQTPNDRTHFNVMFVYL